MDSVTVCSCGRELYPYITELRSLKIYNTKLINYDNKDSLKPFLDKYKFLTCCRMNLISFTRISDQIKIDDM